MKVVIVNKISEFTREKNGDFGCDRIEELYRCYCKLTNQRAGGAFGSGYKPMFRMSVIFALIGTIVVGVLLILFHDLA